MKTLDILPYIPYPLDTGGNQAVFNMLSAMVKEHEVHLLLRANTSKDLDAIEDLQKELPQLVLHVCDERGGMQENVKKEEVEYTMSMRFFDYLRKSMERKIKRRLRKLTAQSAGQSVDMLRLYTTLYNFLPEYSDKYLKFVYDTSRLGFDLIQCEFYETLGLVNLLPEDARKVFIHHELRYIRNANELSLLKEKTPTDIFVYNKMKDDELAALKHFDTVVTLTAIDRDLLLKEIPGLNIYVSPAIVKYNERPQAFTALNGEMAFVGSGNHFPNFDGLLWYCREVAPALRSKGKEPLLHVVGVWPEDKRSSVNATGANVQFTGFVDDLHSFLNGKMMIVPIRIGSGMRMKILDAIDSASPIVSTFKGCEGLDFKDGEDMFICDSPQDFAARIIQLLGDDGLQKTFVDNSRGKLLNAFTPAKQIETRMKLYAM